MLDISFGLMLLTAILFIVLIYLLNQMVYVPLLDYVNRRDELIKEDLKNASNMDESIHNLKKEAHDVIANAKAEAHKLKENALNSIKAQMEEAISKKKEVLENEYAKFLAELEKEKESVRENLLAHLPEFQKAIKNKISKA
ncbi:MAG: hypothetical protein GXO31_06670 [Epsilonproteobacteria bacterium]|nr:hypothetical protein [Campylobacterota bacterium]